MQARPVRESNPEMSLELLVVLLFGISIFIFVSLLGIGGYAMHALADILFGVFGSNAYVFPFLLSFLTIFNLVNRGVKVAQIQTGAVILLFLTFCGILQLILVPEGGGQSLREYYEVGAQYHTGGGFIGGSLTSLFLPTLGSIGTSIVLVAALLLFSALATQKSLFVDAGKRNSESREERKIERLEAKERARAKARERREIEQARRERDREARQRAYDPDSFSPVFAQGLSGSTGKAAPAELISKQSALKKGDVSFGDEQDTDRSLTGKLRKAWDKLADTSVIDLDEDYDEEQDYGAAHPKVRSIFLDGESQPSDGAGMTKGKSSGARKTKAAQKSLQMDDEDSREEEREACAQREAAVLSPSFQINRGGASDADVDTEREIESEEMEEDLPAEKPVRRASSGSASPSSAPKAQPQAQTKKAARKKAALEEEGGSAEDVASEIAEKQEETEVPYEFPSIDYLAKVPKNRGGVTDDSLRETAAKLQQILATFGVSAQVTNVSCGPSVTRYELLPEMGTKVSKIVNLADDIKLNLAVTDIRIEAPIPGKAAVGIEVPNKEPSMVYLRELIDSEEFRKQKSRLAYVVGKDIAGRIIASDIAKMPHLLIAGATGSGKSVFINTMIMSIIYHADPNEVKLIMIDPKVVELSVYNGIPHLFIPVVTDPKKAAGALNWGVAEMTKRYKMFAEVGVRNLAGYNAKVDSLLEQGISDAPKKMPQIVIIVDELADLMMVSGNEVEDAICRLAQLARACGIHLVIATQRPSVDVITGLIKANIPSRIAFSVSSGTDSRTILDMVGAEKLLGNGDMLFSPQTYKKPVRVQGAFVSDEEIQEVVDFIKVKEEAGTKSEEMKMRMEEVQKASIGLDTGGGGGDTDELFAEAGKFIIEKDKASIGMLQRWFKIGFNRAARIMDQLSDAGVVGAEEGTKPRKVLMSREQFENYLEENG